MKVKPMQRAGGVRVELDRTESQIPSSEFLDAQRVLAEFQLKKILVPIDFSKCSLKALQYAVPFARQWGAELVLLHVVEPVVPVSEMMPLETESVDSTQRELDELKRRIGDLVTASTAVREGNAWMEIVEATHEPDIGLVILATHGRTGLERVILGSVCEKVVRRANCPVLIVREREQEFVAESQPGVHARLAGAEPEI